MTIQISKVVQNALELGAPVVALETGIITHGLPQPLNLEVAREVPRMLLEQDIIPATIGMIDGEIKVGLEDDELAHLATTENLQRISIRDLAVAQVHKLSGGVALAAVLHVAHRVGIKVFASTGLGGIHRAGIPGMQESSDLNALAQHPVVLVTSGVRPSLDHVATIERLESLSVPVLGYQIDYFPGFFVREIGVALDHRVESAEDIGQIAERRDDMGLPQALLVTNSLPTELAFSLDEMKTLVADYVAEFDEQKTNAEGGQDVDYFATRPLLQYLGEATEGKTWQLNVEIYQRNAMLAGEISKVVTSRLDYTD